MKGLNIIIACLRSFYVVIFGINCLFVVDNLNVFIVFAVFVFVLFDLLLILLLSDKWIHLKYATVSLDWKIRSMWSFTHKFMAKMCFTIEQFKADLNSPVQYLWEKIIPEAWPGNSVKSTVLFHKRCKEITSKITKVTHLNFTKITIKHLIALSC